MAGVTCGCELLCVLEIQNESSGRVPSTLNCWVISPDPRFSLSCMSVEGGGHVATDALHVWKSLADPWGWMSIIHLAQVWGTNLGLLREQQMLLTTKPSLQSLDPVF